MPLRQVPPPCPINDGIFQSDLCWLVYRPCCVTLPCLESQARWGGGTSIPNQREQSCGRSPPVCLPVYLSAGRECVCLSACLPACLRSSHASMHAHRVMTHGCWLRQPGGSCCCLEPARYTAAGAVLGLQVQGSCCGLTRSSQICLLTWIVPGPPQHIKPSLEASLALDAGATASSTTALFW